MRKVAKQIEPVALAFATKESQEQPDPIDTMIQLLTQVVGGIEQLHSRFDNLEARLDRPAIKRATKDVHS